MKRLLFAVFILFVCVISYEARSEHATGLVVPEGWEKHAEYLELRRSAELPRHFDWREKVDVKLQPRVKNQGNCGSCWAESRASTIEWALAIKGVKLELSPQELVSCDREMYGCSGGFWDNYEVGGLSRESDFPYKAVDARCKSNLPRQEKIAKWVYVGGPNKTPTTSEIKQAMTQVGPVGVTVSASGSFPNGCSHGGTNHMVVVTGWDDDKGGWYMQNSWGMGWGDKGYAVIKYGCFNIGETSAVAILPASFSTLN